MKLYFPPKTNDPNLDVWLERLVKELEKLTIEDTSLIDQDLTADASPTFAGLTLTTGSGDPFVKGWINFNGTGTIAINDNFNASSIVDGGTGRYEVRWDTDFANNTYAWASLNSVGFSAIVTSATTGIDMYVLDHANNPTDSNQVTIIAIGDQ